MKNNQCQSALICGQIRFSKEAVKRAVIYCRTYGILKLFLEQNTKDEKREAVAGRNLRIYRAFARGDRAVARFASIIPHISLILLESDNTFKQQLGALRALA